MTTHTPYTYLIGWSTKNIWYYGVRFAKNCHPTDLFKTYFTSSTYVKHFIKLHGNPDIIKIRKTFLTKEHAINWENKFLTKSKVYQKNNWLNKTNNKSINSEYCSKHSKGKTYEEIYGFETARRLKLLRSESNRKRKSVIWSENSKLEVSLKYRGANNPKARKICFNLNNIFYDFGTLKEAATFLSSEFKVDYNKIIKVIGNPKTNIDRLKCNDSTKQILYNLHTAVFK